MVIAGRFYPDLFEKLCNLTRKGAFKVMEKENMIVKEISAIKMKSSTLD
jgi:hypothetical protein